MGSTSILVVDDNKMMRDTIRGLLEPEGYAVLSCEDGPSALKLAGEKRFEIILTDFQMPNMNGTEVVKILRQKQPDTFIVGFSIANKKQAFLEAGANQFISKEQLDRDLIPLIKNYNADSAI